jgi:hypothetical protein
MNKLLTKVWVVTPDIRRGFGGYWGNGATLQEANKNAKLSGASAKDLKRAQIFIAHPLVEMDLDGMGPAFTWPGPDSDKWKGHTKPKDGMYCTVQTIPK